MRLTKTTSHAIRIAIDCAEAAGTLVKAADVAKRLDITQLNVFKIIHILSRAGFVETVQGRHGGVRLARSADRIRIGDIVRAIEATEMEVAGAEPDSVARARDTKPNLNVIFDDALEAFISVLDQHTLADMAKSGFAAAKLDRTAQKKRGTPSQKSKRSGRSRSRSAEAGSRGRHVLRT